MKFCKDCKYYNKWYDECRHHLAAKPADLVNGEVIYHTAWYCRKSASLCFEDAGWFEPKKRFFDRFTKQKIDLSRGS